MPEDFGPRDRREKLDSKGSAPRTFREAVLKKKNGNDSNRPSVSNVPAVARTEDTPRPSKRTAHALEVEDGREERDALKRRNTNGSPSKGKEGGFTVVKRKGRPGRRYQAGEAETAEGDLEICPKRPSLKAIYVVGYAPAVSALDMNSYLCKRGICVQSVCKLTSTRPGSVFCIETTDESFENVMKPSFWPARIRYRRWSGPLPEEKSCSEQFRSNPKCD